MTSGFFRPVLCRFRNNSVFFETGLRMGLFFSNLSRANLFSVESYFKPFHSRSFLFPVSKLIFCVALQLQSDRGGKKKKKSSLQSLGQLVKSFHLSNRNHKFIPLKLGISGPYESITNINFDFVELGVDLKSLVPVKTRLSKWSCFFGMDWTKCGPLRSLSFLFL